VSHNTAGVPSYALRRFTWVLRTANGTARLTIVSMPGSGTGGAK